MSTWTRVAAADDVPAGESKPIKVGTLQIALFNVDGTLFAINNLCPHAAGPLHQGFVEEGRVVCPWHGWSFPLSDKNPPNDGLPRYPVDIRDGDVYVDLPEPGELGARYRNEFD